MPAWRRQYGSRHIDLATSLPCKVLQLNFKVAAVATQHCGVIAGSAHLLCQLRPFLCIGGQVFP